MIKFLKAKSEFNQNVIMLMFGSIAAQAIPLMISPILTRLYTPQEFGVYALFYSIISIVIAISTARYETAIMLPKSDQIAISIVYLSVFISLVIALFTLLLVLFFHNDINGWLGSDIAFLIPFMVIVAGTFQSLKMWLNRKKEYKKLAVNRVEQSVLGGLLQLTLGALNFGGFGLIIGQVFGQFIATVSQGIYIKKSGFRAFDRNFCLKAVFSFKRYFYLVKFGVPALLTSRAAQESLILLVGYFMSAGIVGLISLLNRVISVPASILGENLGEVFYQNISQTRKQNSYPMVKSFIVKLFSFSIPLYLTLYFILDISFVWIFGEAWRGALEFMPYLLVVAAFSFVFAPISLLFNYYEVQGWNLIWQTLWLFSNFSVFWFYDHFALTLHDAFLIYTIKQVILYLIGIISFVFYARSIHEK